MLRNFPSEHIFGLPSNRRVRQQVGRATITAACCVVACCKLVRTVPDPGCPRALLPPDGPADRAAGLEEASPAACCKCACMMGCRTKACASSESGMQLLLRASEAFRSTGQSHKAWSCLGRLTLHAARRGRARNRRLHRRRHACGWFVPRPVCVLHLPVPVARRSAWCVLSPDRGCISWWRPSLGQTRTGSIAHC